MADTICSNEFCKLMLTHGVPALGCLPLGYIMFSPYIAIRQIEKNKSLGVYDITPYPFLVVTCLSWVMYGILIKDYYVYAPNMLGYSVGTYYVLSTIRYAPEPMQKKILLIMTVGLTIVLATAMICYLTLLPNGQSDLVNKLLGIQNIITLLFMNASPLFGMAEIIRTKNSQSIYVPFTTGVFFCSLLFTIYGIIIKEIFITIPNVMSFVLASIQFALVIMFRGNKSKPTKSNHKLPTSLTTTTTTTKTTMVNHYKDEDVESGHLRRKSVTVTPPSPVKNRS